MARPPARADRGWDDYGNQRTGGDDQSRGFHGDRPHSSGRSSSSGADRSDSGDDRGFFDRASDELARWFGDEDAARRREMDHRGRGPSGYTRSDERISDDVCDRLTEDSYVDASNITVSVDKSEVTLNGTVSDRFAKRRAEDCVDAISGVRHVQNNLRVKADPATPQFASSTGQKQGENAGAANHKN